MKRKAIEVLLQEMEISEKKPRYDDKIYSQADVDIILKNEREILFNEFNKYILETFRTNSNVEFPTWVFV